MRWTTAVVMATLLFVTVAGCKDDTAATKAQAAKDAAWVAKQRSRSKTRIEGIYQLIRLYAVKRSGSLPSTLEDLRNEEIPDREGKTYFDDTITNPLTGQRPGYLYVKPPAEKLDRIFDPYRTPLVFELGMDGLPDKDGAILWADGTVERKKRDALPVAPTPR